MSNPLARRKEAAVARAVSRVPPSATQSPKRSTGTKESAIRATAVASPQASRDAGSGRCSATGVAPAPTATGRGAGRGATPSVSFVTCAGRNPPLRQYKTAATRNRSSQTPADRLPETR